MNGTETAQALRSKNRKDILLPQAGIKITIVALNVYDFIEAEGELDIPAGALTGLTGRKRRAVVAEALRDAKKQRAYTDFLIRRGVLIPRVASDSTVELEDDQVLMSDFGADHDFIVTQIIELSDFGSKSEAVQKFRSKKTKKRSTA